MPNIDVFIVPGVRLSIVPGGRLPIVPGGMFTHFSGGVRLPIVPGGDVYPLFRGERISRAAHAMRSPPANVKRPYGAL